MDRELDADSTADRDSSSTTERAARPCTSQSIVEAPGRACNNATNACDTILQVAELLGRMLSYLPPRKIFEIQRVSRYWNEVIATCPEIQKMLFLRPLPAGRPLKAWEVVDSGMQRIQRDKPNLGRLQLHEFEVRHGQENANVDGHILILPVAMNPVLKKGYPPRGALVKASDHGVMEYKIGACSEGISYYGAMVPLERYACMQLT